MPNRKMVQTGAAIAAIAIVVVLVVWRLWASRERTPLRVAVVTWVGFGPFYIAQEKGFFKEEGLNVELARIDDFGARRAALASGKLDASVETVDSLAVGLAEGLPALEVLVVDESYGGDGIVARKEISSLAELKGKTIACAKSTPSHFFLLYLLDREGLMPSDFTLKPMEAGDAGAAFVAGQVDAAVTWEPWLTKAKETEHGRVITTSREHPGVIADIFVVHPNLARDHPKDVTALLRAWFKAIQFVKDHRQEAIALMAKHLELPPEELAGMLEGIRFPSYDENLRFFGIPSGENRFEQMFKTAADLYKKAGLINTEKQLDPRKTYDVSFLRDLNK
ncbi:MAG: ABC transporter substrate-binding protein [Planctomycetes bacterium]|nr:ABC transporter substrate-binding protein [Planctomycetota bacterium]